MKEILEAVADEINYKRHEALELFVSQRDCLPVDREVKEPEEVFEAFNDLRGMDMMAITLYQAGYIQACVEILHIVEQSINGLILPDGGQSTLPGVEDRKREMGGGAA